jgi:hypothetical protein
MRVSSSCRVWSSSERTTIFASSACGRTSQPSTVRQSQATMASRHGGLHFARRCKETYTNDKASAETGAPVEPVIVLELVDLDALAIVGRWRYQCHSLRYRFGRTPARANTPSRVWRAIAMPCAVLVSNWRTRWGGRWAVGLGARWR